MPRSPFYVVCPGQDLNLHALNEHQPLKLACLPIPPPGHGIYFLNQFGFSKVSQRYKKVIVFKLVIEKISGHFTITCHWPMPDYANAEETDWQR